MQKTNCQGDAERYQFMVMPMVTGMAMGMAQCHQLFVPHEPVVLHGPSDWKAKLCSENTTVILHIRGPSMWFLSKSTTGI